MPPSHFDKRPHKGATSFLLSLNYTSLFTVFTTILLVLHWLYFSFNWFHFCCIYYMSILFCIYYVSLSTLRLHYNAVYIYFQYICENVRRSQYTQCKLWNSYSLCISYPSLTPVNLPWGGVNGSLDIQCLRKRGACDWAARVCRMFNT